MQERICCRMLAWMRSGCAAGAATKVHGTVQSAAHLALPCPFLRTHVSGCTLLHWLGSLSTRGAVVLCIGPCPGTVANHLHASIYVQLAADILQVVQHCSHSFSLLRYL